MDLVIFIFYLLACILCAHVASQKNRSATAWFFVAVFLTPLLAMLALIASPAKSAEQVRAERRSNIGFYGCNY